MAILSVITAPDPRLKVTSTPVERVDEEVRRLMDDLLETMYSAPGIGLAAPQVGLPKRVIVVDLAGPDEDPRPLRLANPELVRVSDEEVTYEEGCLSVPDHYADVTRPIAATIRYLDYDNEVREIEPEGLLATCLQHEIDHLEGILFIDHLTALKRDIILRKLAKAHKAVAAAPA
jgi:peptide deformylase